MTGAASVLRRLGLAGAAELETELSFLLYVVIALTETDTGSFCVLADDASLV
jgi:hypothetical protein